MDYSRRKDAKQTTQEKRMVLRDFSAYCINNGVDAIKKISPRVIQDFLNTIYDTRGANVANKYLKNLKTAWTWGASGMVEGFPKMQAPFRKEHKYDSAENTRYVPPDADIINVIEHTQGQDRIMMLLFVFTAARAGEVFRLQWSDVDFANNCIYLQDHKGGAGHKYRRRMIQMHPILVNALRWWHDARPCNVDYVFFQTQNDAMRGQPFAHRSKFLPNLCAKLGIKPFGFHALRHRAAAIVFAGAGPHGLLAAQKLLGHYRATTTDRYVANAGLYAGQEEILDALSQSAIGRAMGSLDMTIPPDGTSIRGNVTRSA